MNKQEQRKRRYLPVGSRQSGLDRFGCLIALQISACRIEVDGVLMKITVLQHERMLVVDGDLRGLHQRGGDGVALIDSSIRSAIGGIRPDRRCGRPDERRGTFDQIVD